MTIVIRRVSPKQEDVRELIHQLDQYQQVLYPDESNHLDPIDALCQPGVHFVAAYDDLISDGDALGCGAIKYVSELAEKERYGEIKRLYVKQSCRGKGVSTRIMAALESDALEKGIGIVRLETGIFQDEAIGLYKKIGYLKTGAFGPYSDEDPFSVFMEKKLN